MDKPDRTIPALLAVMVLVGALWNTSVMLPLKVLVVFFHELSHGLAAVLTGGELDRISVEMNQSGTAWTRGGSRFVTLNAGYLGSFLWGAALIMGSAAAKRDRLLTGALGLVLAGVTLFYVRNLAGIGFGLAAAAALLAAARWLSHEANDFVLKVVGVTSCGYAILDIYSDAVVGSCRSDARALAQMTLVPASVWSALWIGLSLAGLFFLLRWTARPAGRGRR